ncbi:hypothetical protein PMAYCL1PPCAC_26722, partial [Pristionchus mayeri]
TRLTVLPSTSSPLLSLLPLHSLETTTTSVIPTTSTTKLSTSSTSTKASTTTRTTTNITNCCTALTQLLAATEYYPDGLMTFTYNNNACKTAVSVSCSQTDPAFELYAAIVANGDNFLGYQPNSIIYPGKCSGGIWHMGIPPIAIETLACRLTNP